MWRSKVAAESRELVADLGDGAGGIVAQRGDQDRDAARTVTFVRHLDVVDALELARSFLDRALDVLLGHRSGLGRIDRCSEPRVMRGIAPGKLRGHRDLANELGELRSALGVGRGLVVLDLLPFAMAGHISSVEIASLCVARVSAATRTAH